MNEKYKKINFNFEALESCPFCGNGIMVPNGKINWLDNDFWYVICPQCGLKYMNPRPDKKSYQEFYKDLFWQQKIRNLGFKKSGQMWNIKRYKWDNDENWDTEEGRKNRIEKQRVQRVKTIIPVIKDNINLDAKVDILEVGSGFGITLEEFHKNFDSNVYAIEPSNEARKAMKKQGYISIIGYYSEELKKISEEEKKFDVIIFSHSLENTVEPLEIMQYAKKCLKPKGIIYLQTPNLLVFDQMNPYHPFIFSLNSLKFLAKKINMKFIHISKYIDQMLIVVYKKYEK